MLITITWIWTKDLSNQLNIILKNQSNEALVTILLYKAEEKISIIRYMKVLNVLPYYSKYFFF
jgi:hypothetical protein